MIDKKDEFKNLPEQVIEPDNKPAPVKDFISEYLDTLGDGTLTLLGIATGFKSLDKATLGLDGLIVLGGIAGAGKTSLALQLALNAKIPTLFYSLEMPRRAIITKALSNIAGLKYTDILLKGNTFDLEDKVKKGLGEITKQGDAFYIRTRERGQAEISFETLETEINYLKVKHKAERVFVVIDHLQVFPVDNARDQIDKESQLITGFKGLSERTGAIILLISQKNKAGFQSAGGLQAIKGSVDIVYLADVVMFLEKYLIEKTLPNSKELAFNEIDEAGDVKQIILSIDKNRYNAPNKLYFEFEGAYSRFTEKKLEDFKKPF